MNIFNIFKSETINIPPSPNRSRCFEKRSNGISFTDPNHLIYVEKIMAKNRENRNEDLKVINLPEDPPTCLSECPACGDLFPTSFGEFIPFKQIDVDDFEERWECEVCINKTCNDDYIWKNKENK